MAIRVRRGNEADFDANKMLPGEWAVSLDTKYVRMCFAPGVCLRMATYEGFESDMERVEAILAEVESIEQAIKVIQRDINANVDIAIEQKELAAEYAEQSKGYARQAKDSADRASAVTKIDYASSERAGIVAPQDIYVDPNNGQMELIASANTSELKNSFEGGLRFKEMEGKSEQNGTPTPEAPIDIKSVDVREIKTSGKNLLENTATSKIVKGVNITVNNDKSITLKGTCTEWGLQNLNYGDNGNELDGTYYITGGTSKVPIEAIVNTQAVGRDKGNGYKVTFDKSLGANKNWIRITVTEGVTYNETIYPMLRKCDDKGNPIGNDTYEPYQESSVTLSNLKLNGIGDIKDRLIRKDGLWQIERNVLKYSISGNETISTQIKNDIIRYSIMLPTLSENLDLGVNYNMFLCTKGIARDNYNDVKVGHFGIETSGDYARFVYNYYNDTTTAEFIADIKGTEVLYVLKTPTYEVLPTADQVALNSLLTFDGITYLSIESELEPTYLYEYGTSKVGGYTLKSLNTSESNEARIKAMESITNNLTEVILQGEE